VTLEALPFEISTTSTQISKDEEGYTKFLPLSVLSFAELNLLAATTAKHSTNSFEHALRYAIEGKFVILLKIIS
jgi:hypothetical protein